jgi:pyruvate dehydrogenase E2 component (dihydrolipoamide acetyltransferase)
LRPLQLHQTLPSEVFVPAGEVLTEEIKNSQMRKIIAKRLAESLFTAPHYNLTIEVTMDDAMKSAIINNIPDTKVSFNDMVIKACYGIKETSKLTPNGRKKQLQSTIMLVLVLL